MKPKLTLALMAIITSSAFAGIPKVLPEFKNAQQLAEWREEMAAKSNAVPSTSDVRCSTLDVPYAFYTGKPYIESTGSYAFKYRSYNPELARWTSEDPSGFPDGANLYCYINNQSTSAYDFLGLAKKVLWLAGLPGGYELNQWTSETIGSAHMQFYNELQNMDIKDNPKPHYLDDGDIFTYGTFCHPDDLASFTGYDQIYIACNGATDITGYDAWGPIRVLNGKWKLDGESYNAFAFYMYTNVKMVYGCNPTDGFIKTQTLFNKFKEPTKNFLYE